MKKLTKHSFMMFFIITILLMNNCATVMKGMNERLLINTKPEGVEIFINGFYAGKTPLPLNLETNKSYHIEFRSPDKESKVYILNRKVKTGWLILDVLTGIIPVFIDAATGALYSFDENKIFINVQGEQFVIQEKETATVRVRKKDEELGLVDGKQIVYPPMPGKILKTLVSEGQKVKKKQSLAIVEAMKMEHEIKSALDGIVKKINYQEEQMVDTEDPIMELEEKK